MDGQVIRFLEANSLVRVRFVKPVGVHEPNEVGIMPFTRAVELIERGIVKALDVGRDGGPVKFHVTPPIDGHIHVVE